MLLFDMMSVIRNIIITDIAKAKPATKSIFITPLKLLFFAYNDKFSFYNSSLHSSVKTACFSNYHLYKAEDGCEIFTPYIIYFIPN